MVKLHAKCGAYQLRKTIANHSVPSVAPNHTDCCMRDIGSYWVIPGTQAPTVQGRRRSFRYETRGGRPIYHPSAYAKCGWSNMVYVAAEFFTVTVGIDWLVANTKTASKSVKRQVKEVRVELARSTPEARHKQAMRLACRKTVSQPCLKERLKVYKRQRRLDALCSAGIEFREGMGFWDWQSSARFPFAVKWADGRGVMVGIHSLPTVEEAVAALEEGWQQKLERDAAFREQQERRAAEEAEKYAKLVAATMPPGRVQFTSEGSYYIVPSNN